MVYLVLRTTSNCILHAWLAAASNIERKRPRKHQRQQQQQQQQHATTGTTPTTPAPPPRRRRTRCTQKLQPHPLIYLLCVCTLGRDKSRSSVMLFCPPSPLPPPCKNNTATVRHRTAAGIQRQGLGLQWILQGVHWFYEGL